jgi:hypothetical protein
MLQINCSFRERPVATPVGFELGDMEFSGELGTVTSRSRVPDQSMMIILSVVGLLDGIRRFLSARKAKEYKFVGVDSSFSVVFRRQKDGQISVQSDNHLIHVSAPSLLKSDIERSVLTFVHSHDLAQQMNVAEANDFHNALQSFQEFSTD